MRRLVIMGVAGCGKTSVGQALAAKTDLTYIDGDDLHPPANIAKMSAGIPLGDDDRKPWLFDVGRHLGAAGGQTAIGCSALKRKYRDWIRAEAGNEVAFIHLSAPREVIAERMNTREGHFMPPALLDSQFADLETLEPDEHGWEIDIAKPLSEVVEDVLSRLDPET